MSNKDPENVSWFPELTEGEKVKHWEHPSIIPSIPVFLAGIVGALAGIWGYFFTSFGYLSLAITPFGILMFLSEYLRRITTHYVLTDKKVVKKTDIVGADPRDLDYSDMEDVDPMQGREGIVNAIFERHLFGYGDIKLTSASGRTVNLDNVASYQTYYDFLSKKNSESTIRDVVAEHSDSGSGESEDATNDEKETVPEEETEDDSENASEETESGESESAGEEDDSAE